MNNRRQLICGLILLLTCTQAGIVAAQQVALSAVQARQVLLGYLQKPDTTLPSIPVTYSNDLGHTTYLFRGDKDGEYIIDAVSGQKSLAFAGLSRLGKTPANFVPAQQMRQSAIDYVAAHFPGYRPGLLTVTCGPVDIQYDADEYFVHFYAEVPSGADLPIHCRVIVEEDSGKIKFYNETNIPLVVSVNPAINHDQAIQIGQNWIQQNISADVAAAQLNTDIGGQAPVKLEVAVDSAMQETLQYGIYFSALFLYIDAQSGAVIGSDGYASVSGSSKSGPTSPLALRECFWPVYLNADVRSLSRSAITANGQTYLWVGQLKLMGIQTKMQSGEMVLSKAKAHIALKVSKEMPAKEAQVWMRNGSAYVPLPAIQRLSDRVRTGPTTQQVRINTH